jgi:hypothetical protein
MSVAGNLGRQSFPVPVGSIFLFAGPQSNPPPDTYLVCDGSVFNPAIYPLLDVALGGSVLPDLRQKIIGGGPVVDVGLVVPPVTGVVTAGSFTLTKQNIPSVPFDVSVATISTVVSANSGVAEIMYNPLLSNITVTSPGNQIQNTNPSVVGVATFQLPNTSVYTNASPTTVTPTVSITAGNEDPAVLVFRYIIKAEY